MSVCLVTYVPYQPVIRSIKYVMKGHSQFYYSQTGCKMSRITRQFIYNVLTQFTANFGKLLYFKSS